ncbi:MAG: hypothetical protein JRE64_13995, partial [Deltaproteobacteria bacterium]|nr:hypothetical protein [Deltaproteobacteria bacterium]
VIKNSMMHLIEVITEKDPNKQPKDFIPGTMLGMVLGLTGATIKAVIEIIEII